MAIPIKETPVLRGKRAIDFILKAEKTANSKPNIKEKERVFRIYNKIKSK